MIDFKKAPLITYFLLLTACGFQPVYGDHAHSAPVAEEMNQVAIDSIPDRTGQILRNNLIDRMYGKGRPKSTRYTLTVTMAIVSSDLGIQADATSTRTLMDTTANFTLKDLTGKAVLTGAAHSVTSYNKLDDQYASLVSNESATQRTLNEVSEQIINRLSLYFAERAEPNAPPEPAPAPTPVPVFQKY